MTIWSDLDHRLSAVKRWGTAQTVHQQSVAEHIFNVERIAVRIAREWFGIQDEAMLFNIMWFAHRHEDFEALSGDFPTMVKPYFDEAAFEKEHRDLIEPPADGGHWVREIVKLADMLDSLWFLIVEKKLGSVYLARHLDYEPSRIIQFTEKTWPNNIVLLRKVNTCIDSMFEENSVRHSKRGR